MSDPYHVPTPTPPPRKGMSRNAKVALILGGLLAAVVVGSVATAAVSGSGDEPAAAPSASPTPTPTPTPTPSSPSPTPSATPTTSSPEPVQTEQTFSQWAGSAEGHKYIRFTGLVAKLGRALSNSADVGSFDLVAKGCQAFGKAGHTGLSLPDSPDPQFNAHWDAAMRHYVKAGSYAPLIRAQITSGVTGCADAITSGTAEVTKVTAIIQSH